MVKPAIKTKRNKTEAKPQRNLTRKTSEAQEEILRKATLHLIRKIGGLFVATALREVKKEGGQHWIITVTMRYPTGHEGYVGDLLYDGIQFTMLTQDSVIDERVQTIATDPEGIRLWNEYRSSTLRAGKE